MRVQKNQEKPISETIMKLRNLVTTMAFCACLMAPAVTYANGSGAGIVGSPHDFSTSLWNFRQEICRVCHVPHDHDRNYDLFANGLLWNHQLSAETYRMYAEEGTVNPNFASFIDGTFDTEPTGVAKLCLGCHDGTVGIDQFDRATGDPGAIFIGDIDTHFQVPGGGVPTLGGDKNLTGSHPYSIVYDEIADPGLNPMTNAMGSSGTIQDVLEPSTIGFKVQCSSCHDVHDGVGEAVPDTHLLRVSQRAPASGLCLTCHAK